MLEIASVLKRLIEYGCLREGNSLVNGLLKERILCCLLKIGGRSKSRLHSISVAHIVPCSLIFLIILSEALQLPLSGIIYSLLKHISEVILVDVVFMTDVHICLQQYINILLSHIEATQQVVLKSSFCNLLRILVCEQHIEYQVNVFHSRLSKLVGDEGDKVSLSVLAYCEISVVLLAIIGIGRVVFAGESDFDSSCFLTVFIFDWEVISEFLMYHKLLQRDPHTTNII